MCKYFANLQSSGRREKKPSPARLENVRGTTLWHTSVSGFKTSNGMKAAIRKQVSVDFRHHRAQEHQYTKTMTNTDQTSPSRRRGPPANTMPYPTVQKTLSQKTPAVEVTAYIKLKERMQNTRLQGHPTTFAVRATKQTRNMH